jgi:PAS domain S-box-containing protein
VPPTVVVPMRWETASMVVGGLPSCVRPTCADPLGIDHATSARAATTGSKGPARGPEKGGWVRTPLGEDPTRGLRSIVVDVMSDGFLSSIVDAAPDGMLVVDGEGTIVFANHQAGHLFALEHGELIGSPVDHLLPDHVRTVHRAHRLRYQAEPTVRPMGAGILLQARRGDGVVFPVEVSLSPLVDGDRSFVVAVVRDVTARVRDEDHMRRVLSTLDAAEDGLFVMDLETMRFEYVNDGACRQVGYPRDELIGMTPMHINPSLSEDELRQAVELAQVGVSPARIYRTVHRRRDGTDIPVEMTLHVAPAAQDGSVSMTLVARDIRERVEAEEKARQGEAALRKAEQVIVLADDRERIARDLHDTVIQRLFASGLALQAIAARADAEVSRRVERVVDDLDATIREVRTAIFSLQGDPLGRGNRMRIMDLLDEASHDLGFEPQLRMDGAIEGMDDTVVDQLLPTLREALTNVAKHARAGRVEVSLSADDDEVRLVVSDDGVGLADEPDLGRGLGNMEKRAFELGGNFEARAGVTGGTDVVWTVPSRPDQPA